jgi:hypothetical protein
LLVNHYGMCFSSWMKETLSCVSPIEAQQFNFFNKMNADCIALVYFLLHCVKYKKCGSETVTQMGRWWHILLLLHGGVRYMGCG